MARDGGVQRAFHVVLDVAEPEFSPGVVSRRYPRFLVYGQRLKVCDDGCLIRGTRVAQGAWVRMAIRRVRGIRSRSCI